MAGGIIAAAIVATIANGDTIRLSTRDVQLGDVAHVAGRQSATLGKVRIARMAAGQRLTVSRAALANLIRRAVPGVTIVGDTSGSLQLLAGTSKPTPRLSCFATRIRIPAGAAIAGDTVSPLPCEQGRSSEQLWRDSETGEVHADRPLDAGTYLGRLWVPPAPAVRRGDRVTLMSVAGPVRIARTVTALQPTGATQPRLFVAGDGGPAFSAPFQCRCSQ